MINWKKTKNNQLVLSRKTHICWNLLRLLLLSDHQEWAYCSRQGVQTQADPENPPETRTRMPCPGHFPQGAGDGGGTNTVYQIREQLKAHHFISASPCIVSYANLLFAPPLQRLHQIEIKRKLEEFARRERVHKIKVHHLHLNTALFFKLMTLEWFETKHCSWRQPILNS